MSASLVGSEMCIRDSPIAGPHRLAVVAAGPPVCPPAPPHRSAHPPALVNPSDSPVVIAAKWGRPGRRP
eukprot:5607935-Alexandrium_andersonii.AAC.1